MRPPPPRSLLILLPFLLDSYAEDLEPLLERLHRIVERPARRRRPRLGAPPRAAGEPVEMAPVLAQQVERRHRVHREMGGRGLAVAGGRLAGGAPERQLGRPKRELLEPRIGHLERRLAARPERLVLAPVAEHGPVMEAGLARGERAIAG